MVALRLLFCCSIFAFSFCAYSSFRIKDIADVDGMRHNLLVGKGLVTGLNGTGDNLKNSAFTQKALIDFLERMKVNVSDQDFNTKNIAAVSVTAVLGPFAKQGTLIDVSVQAIGDAKSLRGGTLLPTTVAGPDGLVYAVAHGPILINEFQPNSEDVKSRSSGTQTSGTIHNGAIVEKEIDYQFGYDNEIKISLRNADFTTSSKIVDAINSAISGNVARALDPRTVVISVPQHRRNDIVDFMASVENIEIEPDNRAKIVINESSGTIVVGEGVEIRPVAVAQGNIVVNIGSSNGDGFVNMSEKRQNNLMKAIDRQRGYGMHNIDKSTNLGEFVKILNNLGVLPQDMIRILRMMHRAGAINGVVEVE